jgi:hypothetical protein
MHRMFSRFVPACMYLLLVAGCVAVPTDPRVEAGVTPALPVRTTTASGSSGPASRPPDSQITIVPFPTAIVALPTATPPAQGEVLPTLFVTPRAPEPRPTAGPLRPHASSARTGIAEVDRAIDGVLNADRDSLRALVHFLTTPCTNRQGLGGPPKCNPGETEGTPVEVFPVGGVEGSFARRVDIDRLLQISVTGLYAVYEAPAAAYQEDYWPAGDYGVAFLRPDNSFLIAIVGPNGIVRLDNLPPVGVPDDLSRWMGGKMVLPPVAP